MEESEHALAARRHADKAMSGSGGDDPAALAGTFGRQPSAIRSRLNHLGANSPAAQSGDTGTSPQS